MGWFGSSQTARDAERRRAALPHSAILSPAPGQISPLGSPTPPPGTSQVRSTATVAALAAAKRQRRKAAAPGMAPTVTGRPTSLGAPLTASPRTLIGY